MTVADSLVEGRPVRPGSNVVVLPLGNGLYERRFDRTGGTVNTLDDADIRQAALDKGMAEVERVLERQRRAGRVDEKRSEEIRGRIRPQLDRRPPDASDDARSGEGAG
jgi:hypothetical protein